MTTFTDDETDATSDEYIAVGVMGIFIITALLGVTSFSMYTGMKPGTELFFLFSLSMCILEYPRYFTMAITNSYESKIAYSIHLTATIAFFASFSIVCRHWSSLLNMDHLSVKLYGTKELLIANIFFAVLDIISISLCMASPSLQEFFNSPGFLFITLVEALKNLAYSSFIWYYGLRLVMPLWEFSRQERINAQEDYSLGLSKFIWRTLTGDSNENVFTIVVMRLTAVLTAAAFCFLLRICMLLAKIIVLHSSAQITNRSFSLFGVTWFVFADFIPRVVPTLAFIYLMRLTRPSVPVEGQLHKLSIAMDDQRALGGNEKSKSKSASSHLSRGDGDDDNDDNNDDDRESLRPLSSHIVIIGGGGAVEGEVLSVDDDMERNSGLHW